MIHDVRAASTAAGAAVELPGWCIFLTDWWQPDLPRRLAPRADAPGHWIKVIEASPRACRGGLECKEHRLYDTVDVIHLADVLRPQVIGERWVKGKGLEVGRAARAASVKLEGASPAFARPARLRVERTSRRQAPGPALPQIVRDADAFWI